MYRRGITYPTSATFSKNVLCSNATSRWYRTHRDPDVKHDISGFRQRIPTGVLRVFLLVPKADLITGYTDDDNPKNRVEVVLRRAASESGFGLEQVDDIADDDLDNVEDEKSESESLSHGLDTGRV